MRSRMSPRRARRAGAATMTPSSWFSLAVLLTAAGCAGDVEPPGNPGHSPASACAPLRGPTNLLQSSLPGTVPYDGLVSDGQSLYFTSVRTLYRLPITGGAAETVQSGTVAPFFAAVPGTVVWAEATADHLTGLTAKSAGGARSAPLPAGAVPAWELMLVDTEGYVYFEVDLPGGGRSHTWRWSPSSGAAGEMPGVGMADVGGGTNLYWVDRGQVLWSNNAAGPAGGVYVTDVATGVPRQILGNDDPGFGSPIGGDAVNVYGAGDICPKSVCPFTVSGVARSGGDRPFVAYQSEGAYWTTGLRADGSGVYWIDWVTRAIYHVAMSPGARADLVVQLSGATIPARLALDACNVYWLELDATGAPRVMAIAK
jgi:hypothetical protein